MKETLQISIGGYAFTLEKDAETLLREYLGSLEQHYLDQEGGPEILEGIEERIAELLLDRCPSGTVAGEAQIRQIIDIIGHPEKIEADDPAGDRPAPKPKRRLFRDMDNKRLGGVCSGLGAYFKTDPTWFRLGFTLLTVLSMLGGLSDNAWILTLPLLYCILWIAMPAARTAEDRWAMKGESGTVDEITRNVRAGVQEVGQAAREVSRSDGFKKLFRIFLIIIGIGLLLAGTAGLAAISIASLKVPVHFSAEFALGLDALADEAPALAELLSTPWFEVLLALVLILPFVGILYGGIMLIFGFKSPSWRPGLVIFVLWLILLVVVIAFIVGANIPVLFT